MTLYKHKKIIMATSLIAIIVISLFFIFIFPNLQKADVNTPVVWQYDGFDEFYDDAVKLKADKDKYEAAFNKFLAENDFSVQEQDEYLKQYQAILDSIKASVSTYDLVDDKEKAEGTIAELEFNNKHSYENAIKGRGYEYDAVMIYRNKKRIEWIKQDNSRAHFDCFNLAFDEHFDSEKSENSDAYNNYFMAAEQFENPGELPEAFVLDLELFEKWEREIYRIDREPEFIEYTTVTKHMPPKIVEAVIKNLYWKKQNGTLETSTELAVRTVLQQVIDNQDKLKQMQ